eukprot:COSAG02_NODE_58933_length_276_cov_0.401130_1_plen_59_part_01
MGINRGRQEEALKEGVGCVEVGGGCMVRGEARVGYAVGVGGFSTGMGLTACFRSSIMSI